METRIRLWHPQETKFLETTLEEIAVNGMFVDHIPLQCTGLKVKTIGSKKKTLLYEGDTVSTSVMNKAEGEVKFGEGRFYIEYKDGHTLSFISENLSNVIKIGDIYQGAYKERQVSNENTQKVLGI